MTNVAADSKSFIDGFIRSRVTGQGLDRRTEKAYRLDLEHFYAWIEGKKPEKAGLVWDLQRKEEKGETKGWEDWIEAYLDYLTAEKNLSRSTVCRKNRVLGYYSSYLAGQGVISLRRSLQPARGLEKKQQPHGPLSKKEADAFFAAMAREYQELESEFRKRICLRDMVMMELLFYHKIEISELLRLEVTDYHPQAGILSIRRKRGGAFNICLFSKELRRKMGLWLEERILFRRQGEYQDRMFLSKLGRPLSMEMVIRIFDKYRTLARIEREFTPRDLKEGSMKQYARELVIERCNG
ncbi:MAG: tyrosine-type recombinase/integrase [Lachnospiraceae bacterium]|nr:tyrosine-type recombinase/integrase [Lachnospiraceae bacterium]